MRLPILTESCKRNRRKTLGHDPLFFTQNDLLKSIFSLDERVRSLTRVKISQDEKKNYFLRKSNPSSNKRWQIKAVPKVSMLAGKSIE